MSITSQLHYATLDGGSDEVRAGQPAVARDDDLVEPAVLRLAADRSADKARNAFGQGLADDAADIVGTENATVDLIVILDSWFG